MSLLRPTLLTLACLLATPGMASELPSLGDASSAIVSPQQEHQLGRAWLSLVRGQVSQLDDPQLKDFIETSVYRLSETSQLQDRRLEFVLLNSPQINAFAAPGGIVGVNGGLFLYAQTEAEYASVMAHELAHLSQRHFARGLEAQQRMQIPVMAGLLAGIVAAAAGAGDLGIAAIATTQAAAMQEQRRFSRQNEQEADRIGLVNLEKAGFDPRAMPSMFERLMRQYRYDRRPPEFLLTHPVSESRIADTRNRAEQYTASGVTDSVRYQLMRARVQLIYEETPGIAAKRFRSMLDENPNMEAPRYGLALAQLKSGQHKHARESLQPLLEHTPNDISYNLAQVELDMAANRLADAQKRITRLLTLYPNNYPVNQAHIDLLMKQVRTQEAEQALDEMLKSRSNDPDVWYQVAEVRGLSGNTIGLHQARGEFFALIGDYKQALEQLDFAKRRASNNFQLASRIDARQRELIEEQRIIEQMLR
ncbi:Putative Zn-dependent protease, contains TPR repeats [Pseudomonas guineae]|uniref:Putative beta-barrel assembly-enhancing protease n=1 Tax=Pseudomonas guineae TaxID=425504 RepID=A0A1I3CCX6_9PSED|nr:M48 family metalloprotease [Pseudomonas guineae]SFH72146.1 Putative Zn-dependent protease, contains TPR repeats [Pseudomonas guineae]|tara:strand:- start:2577 stop:4010 length:1434 start_codon:yes stop_codon:yes gene_type:complete